MNESNSETEFEKLTEEVEEDYNQIRSGDFIHTFSKNLILDLVELVVDSVHESRGDLVCVAKNRGSQSISAQKPTPLFDSKDRLYSQDNPFGKLLDVKKKIFIRQSSIYPSKVPSTQNSSGSVPDR